MELDWSTTLSSYDLSTHPFAKLRMPSRQERRRAERDAAKRAPAKAAGAEGPAARVDVTKRPLGDWKTQAADPWLLLNALGVEILKLRVAEGDREAQWTQGCLLRVPAGGGAGMAQGASGRSTQADAGLARCTAQFPVAHKTEMRCGTFS